MADRIELLPQGRRLAQGGHKQRMAHLSASALRGAILAAGLCLSACQTTGPQDITGSISDGAGL